MPSGEVIHVDFERGVTDFPVIEAGALATGTFGEEFQAPQETGISDPLMTEHESAGLGKDFAPQEVGVSDPLMTDVNGGWHGKDFAPHEAEAKLDSDFRVLEAA